MPPPSDLARSTALRAGIAAGALALLAWCLVVFGALVRAHGAGLACPDWPLCFGELIPEFDLQVAFEWGHRVMAGALSVVLAGLVAFVLRVRELRARFAPTIAVILGLLAAQIVLGGLTVLLGLAPWTVTAHLVTGNSFVVSLAWLSIGLREFARPAPVARAELPGAVEKLVAVCALVLVIQFVLGGLVSSNYAGLACATFPLCNSDSLAPSLSGPVGLHVLHRLNAYLLCGAYALLVWRARGCERIGRLSALALGIAVSQVAVGVANVLMQVPREVTGLHSALATALALTTAIVVREALAARLTASASAQVASRGPRALEGAR
jgi:cytochrome c oxidase assembly protein subunit 15